VILDLGLPQRDGLEVLVEMQARYTDAALLVLTGRDDLHARVRCLDLGADDCLLKPFSFLELMARCRALLRRRQRDSNTVLRYGKLELYRMEHRVLRAGQEIPLTTKEFGLLECLLLHRGQTVSRSQLLEQVWKLPRDTGTNLVDVYINYLRKKLEVGGFSGRELIETVRGTGYRIGGSQKGHLQVQVAPSVSATEPAMAAG
jgi:DNA-binding response OmpR family regulator